VPEKVLVPVKVCAVDRLATSDKVLLPKASVLFVRVSVPVKVAKEPAVNAALAQVEPVHTNRLLVDVFQYKAPVSKALPSLSTDGAEALRT
jgi:hypothetical protein